MPQNINSLYGIEVYNASSQLLADLTGLAVLEDLVIERNRAGSCELSVDARKLEDYCINHLKIDPLDLFAVNLNEIRVRRGTRYLWGGQISYLDLDIESDQEVFNVKVSGWLDLLAHRYTASERVFTAEDAGIIAKTLIDETQALTNGSFGIVTHTDYIQTSVDRDRTYSYDEVKEKIVQLSEVINGFDFEISYDKKFYVYYPQQGVDRTADVLFEYPKNVKSIGFERDGTEMVNEVLAFGNGIQRTRTDSTYQATYKLRQIKEDHPSVSETDTLDEHGDETLRVKRNYKDLISKLYIDGKQSPQIGAYWIGDLIKVRVSGFRSLEALENTTYRIDSIRVNLDENLSETIEISLSLP